MLYEDKKDNNCFTLDTEQNLDERVFNEIKENAELVLQGN